MQILNHLYNWHTTALTNINQSPTLRLYHELEPILGTLS